MRIILVQFLAKIESGTITNIWHYFGAICHIWTISGTIQKNELLAQKRFWIWLILNQSSPFIFIKEYCSLQVMHMASWSELYWRVNFVRFDRPQEAGGDRGLGPLPGQNDASGNVNIVAASCSTTACPRLRHLTVTIFVLP